MDERTKKKIIKIALTIVIAISILFVIMIYLLTYYEKGETNIPFKISQIIIVSSAEGINVQNSTQQWEMDINQNNDIYLYIVKNKSYGKTELIENVKISNFNISKKTEQGQIKIYKPTTEENEMFKNHQDFEIKELNYEGALESNIKQSKISNQGGKILFRCANNNVSKFTSNNTTEVNYNHLLQISNTKQEDLEANISFDIEIKVANKKTYKATVYLELPVEDVITKGRTELVITNLEDIVFKII